MAKLSLFLFTAILSMLFSSHVFAGPAYPEKRALEARDQKADASKILSLLKATQFCSSFINLQDSTIVQTSTGSPTLVTVSNTITLAAGTTTTEVDLPASTTTLTTTVPGSTQTVTTSIPGSTKNVVVTLPGSTASTNIDITTTSSTTVTASPVVTSTVYTFNSNAKRSLEEPGLVPRSAPPVLAELKGFVSSVISDACSLYVHPHTTTTSTSVLGPTTTVTISFTTQLPEVTITTTKQLPESTVQATATPGVVTVSTSVQLPDVTSTSTTQLAAITQTSTVTHGAVTTITTTLAASTTTITSTNAPVCTSTRQLKNEADGYGVYYSQRFTGSATTLTDCCQECYEYSGCQEYIFFYSDTSDTSGQCLIYYDGSQSDHSHLNVSPTCPSGVYVQPNNPSATNPFGGPDYIVGLGQCATF